MVHLNIYKKKFILSLLLFHGDQPSTSLSMSMTSKEMVKLMPSMLETLSGPAI